MLPTTPVIPLPHPVARSVRKRRVSPEEIEATVQKYISRVAVIAAERRGAIVTKASRAFKPCPLSDYMSAGMEGLLSVASRYGDTLTKALADFAIRGRIISAVRHEIAYEHTEAASINGTGLYQPSWDDRNDPDKPSEMATFDVAFDREFGTGGDPDFRGKQQHLRRGEPTTKEVNDAEVDLLVINALAKSGLKKLPPLWRKLLRLRSQFATRMGKNGEKFLIWPEIAKRCDVSRTTAIEQYNLARSYIRDVAAGMSCVLVAQSQSIVAERARRNIASDMEAVMAFNRKGDPIGHRLMWFQQHAKSDIFFNIVEYTYDHPVWTAPLVPCFQHEDFKYLKKLGAAPLGPVPFAGEANQQWNTADEVTVAMSHAVVFKGNRFDHPEYGIGVVKADWSPWGEGVDVLFHDGVVRNIAMRPSVFGQPLVGRTLAERCAEISDVLNVLHSPEVKKIRQAGSGARASKPLTHDEIARIPDWHVLDGVSWTFTGWNPFPKGGPSSSYGAFATDSIWPHKPIPIQHRVYLLPDRLASRKELEELPKESLKEELKQYHMVLLANAAAKDCKYVN